MGIFGARTLMDSDPARFCAEFTWGLDVAGQGANRNNNEHNTLGLLIDAKSLLQHVAFQEDKVVYPSPSTINDLIQIHIHRLLRVVGRKGGVHVFFDGLAPRQQILSHIRRMGNQSSDGERLATQYAQCAGMDLRASYTLNRNDPPSRLLHHLAEWAFVEAVDRLRQRFTNTLHMHRASVGEAEALINQWLIQNDGTYSRVAILSDDTDFLVYDSCPGFVPPNTLIYEERNGQHCIRGRYYIRSKFLRSFPGQLTTMDSAVMTSVAAIAGCDYCTSPEQAEQLANIRNGLIMSDVGGLRLGKRKTANDASALVAVLRGVIHFKNVVGNSTWLHALCKHFTSTPHQAQAALDGLRVIHDVYTYSLQVASNSVLDLVPGMVEVRRLLQHGIMYCYPVVETFRSSTVRNEIDPQSLRPPRAPVVRHLYRAEGGHALVVCPPVSTQLEMWAERYSVWQFPVFKQIRTRLYSYVRLLIYNGRAPASIPPGDFWTSSAEPVLEEIVRMNAGKCCGVDRTHVCIPEHSLVSHMFTKELILGDDDMAVDRALVFCILGAPQQLKTIRGMASKVNGVVFLASLMLPFNLACLLLLMATAPREIVNFDVRKPPFDGVACSEVHRVLPILSVACAHANFLVNTIVAFWPDKALHSYLVLPPINVSSTFRHDNALMIWEILREGRNLEYVESEDDYSVATDEHIGQYLIDCFSALRRLRPREDQEWRNLMDAWQARVQHMYDCWWEVFNLGGVEFCGPVQVKSNKKEAGTYAGRI